MKIALQIIAACLLLLNGVGALYGGWHLMLHPDGSSLGMSLGSLEHSPFHDFKIPGFILFAANGISSLFVFATLLLGYKFYPFLLMAQGAILTVWIITQVILLRTTDPLHLIYGSIGLLLIISGMLLVQRGLRATKMPDGN